MSSPDPSRELDRLLRWERSGGTWRVLPGRGDRLVVVLETCDGGEEMDRLAVTEPDLRAVVDAHRSEATVATVMSIALSTPAALPASATVSEVGRYLAGDHVHLALLVEDDRTLVSCVERSDLAATDLPEEAPARALGTTAGRTVRYDAAAATVAARMAREGRRRLAVVDERGRLVGLVCRKRSGTGFCSDEGVDARRVERSSARRRD